MMEQIDSIMAHMTAWVMRGALPSDMWEGLPYTSFLCDGKVWRITDDCSGITLLFYLAFVAFWRKVVYRHKGCWKLMLAALPLTLVFNALRCVVVMKYSVGPISHDFLGFMTYALVVFPCLFYPLDESNFKKGNVEKESGAEK